MKNIERLLGILTLLIGFVAMGAGGVSWAHSTFVAKDSFDLVREQLNRIETRLNEALDK